MRTVGSPVSDNEIHPASFETSHAIALSAIIGGLLEALLNPITLLVIVIAFVAATWVTRKTSKRTST